MFKIGYDKKITMVQGDTGVIRMIISNYELSQGDEVRFAIVNKANPSILLCQHSDKKIVLEKQVTVFEKDGSARIVIYPYDTEYLQPGKYLYEIQVVTKDGRTDTVVPLTALTLMDGSIQGEYGQTTPSKPEPTPSEIELRFKRLENEIIPELGNRITNVENEIDSVNSSLDNMVTLDNNVLTHGAIPSDNIDSTSIFTNLINDGYSIDLMGKVFKISNTINANDLNLKNGVIIGDLNKVLFNVIGNVSLNNITIINSKTAIRLLGSELKNRDVNFYNCIFDGNGTSLANDSSMTLETKIELNINNSKFINGNNFDINIKNCSISKCLVSNTTFENGINTALLLNPNKETSGNYIITNNIFKNYTNTLTTSDNDAHFIRCTGKKAVISNNIFDGLYVKDGLATQDTEALRPSCDEILIENNLFKNAGYQEGVLALKNCYNSKVINNRFECTDDYIYSDRICVAILCGYGASEIYNNTFVNFNGEILDTEDGTTVPIDSIKLINNTIINSLINKHSGYAFRISSVNVKDVIIKNNQIITSTGNEHKIPNKFLFTRGTNAKSLSIEDNIIKVTNAPFNIQNSDYISIKNNQIEFSSKLFDNLLGKHIELYDNFIGDVSTLSYYSWFGQANSYDYMSVRGLKFTVNNLAEDTRVFRPPYGANVRTDITVKVVVNNDEKFYIANYNGLISDATSIYTNPNNSVIGEDTSVTLRGTNKNSLYYSSGVCTPLGLVTENNSLVYYISFESSKVYPALD